MASGNSIGATNTTALEQLDDYSLLAVFDQLELIELIKLASLSPRFNQLILNHYLYPVYKINEREITLELREDVTIVSPNNNVSDKYIRLDGGYDESMLTLQEFCNTFGHLKIMAYDDGVKHFEGVSRYVNTYCANVQQSFTIFTPMQLNMLDLSLVNVTDVTILDQHYLTDVDFTNLNLAFPRVQKLAITLPMNVNYHLPHLTEFRYCSTVYTDLIDFLRLNPQLRKIDIPFSGNSTHLATVNNLLPNLESLTLTSRFVHTGPIEMTRFKNVRAFNLDFHIYALHAVQFDRLDSFAVYTRDPDSIDSLIEWIVGNTELTKVSLEREELSFEQLSALIAPLTKLRVLEITWQHGSTLSALGRALAGDVVKNSSVERINLHLSGSYTIPRQNVTDILPRDWHIVERRDGRSPDSVHLQRST